MILFVIVAISTSLNILLECAGSSIVYSGTGFPKINSSKPIILLGGLFPVHENKDSTCGGILDLGLQRLEAMVFATSLINKSPDLLPNVTLAFEIRDTCLQDNIALEESLEFVSPRDIGNGELGESVGISGTVGAATSSVSIVVANLLRLFRVPQISYASTAKVLSDKTRFDYFFRTVPSDTLQAQAIADIITNFNWTFIHTIFSGDIYGIEGIKAFNDEVKAKNNSKVCIASSTQISPGTTDKSIFDRAVHNLDKKWAHNSTVVVIFGQLSIAIGILKAVERRNTRDPGFSQRFTWIGSDAWGDQLPSELHYIAMGMLSVAPKAFQSEEFDQYFKSLNPMNYTSNPWFREYWEVLFNCSFMQGKKKRLCDPATEVISSKVGYKQNGKVTFTIDAVYAFAYAIHNMINKACSENEFCSNIMQTKAGSVVVHDVTLLNYLRNVSFQGASSNVVTFDTSGDENGEFIIRNLKKSHTSNNYCNDPVGVWSPTTYLDFHSDIEWHSGKQLPQSVCSLPCSGGHYPEPVSGYTECCWTCRPCLGNIFVSNGTACYECSVGSKPNKESTECVTITPTFLELRSPWGIIILITAVMGIIATVFVMVTFVVLHKHELIKASSRELSAVLLIGLLLCYILTISFIIEPSIPICTVRRFGVGFVFSLCYSALLVRTNRIHRIFKTSKLTLQKPPLIGMQSQLLFTFLLVSVQLVIAIVWLVVERPSTTIIYDGFDAELKCGESAYVGLTVTLSYNLFLLILSTYYAFCSRNIPQNYNEAKYINLTLYSTCIIWLAFIPTYFATAMLGTVYQTCSLVLGIIFSATTALGCLFIPKLYIIFKHIHGPNKHDTKESINNHGREKRRESNMSTTKIHSENGERTPNKDIYG